VFRDSKLMELFSTPQILEFNCIKANLLFLLIFFISDLAISFQLKIILSLSWIHVHSVYSCRSIECFECKYYINYSSLTHRNLSSNFLLKTNWKFCPCVFLLTPEILHKNGFRQHSDWLIIYSFTSPSRIFHLYWD
jgi:hypothetical protein